jgi:enamine deaminase RidA (YjgF/YER057c/UK114 family)
MSLIAINPEALGAPSGYSNGMLAPAGGRLLTVAGQVAWDSEHKITSDAFPGQFAQALSNVLTVVHEAGGRAAHLAQLTIFVTDHREYVANVKEVGAEYRRLMGRHFPAMALVEVKALLEAGAKVEIQALAVLPAEGAS